MNDTNQNKTEIFDEPDISDDTVDAVESKKDVTRSEDVIAETMTDDIDAADVLAEKSDSTEEGNDAEEGEDVGEDDATPLFREECLASMSQGEETRDPHCFITAPLVLLLVAALIFIAGAAFYFWGGKLL